MSLFVKAGGLNILITNLSNWDYRLLEMSVDALKTLIRHYSSTSSLRAMFARELLVKTPIFATLVTMLNLYTVGSIAEKRIYQYVDFCSNIHFNLQTMVSPKEIFSNMFSYLHLLRNVMKFVNHNDPCITNAIWHNSMGNSCVSVLMRIIFSKTRSWAYALHALYIFTLQDPQAIIPLASHANTYCPQLLIKLQRVKHPVLQQCILGILIGVATENSEACTVLAGTSELAREACSLVNSKSLGVQQNAMTLLSSLVDKGNTVVIEMMHTEGNCCTTEN